MAFDSTLQRPHGLMPQRADGMAKATALSVAVHVGLVVALAFGVAWRSSAPTTVSAELWSAVPQVAAPTPVAPPPAPAPAPQPPKPVEPPKPTQQQIDAQIAIEREKAERKQREQQEKERERLEREKAEKLAAQKQREQEAKRQREEQARQAKLREDNLKRMLAEAGSGAPDSAGTAARDAAPSASYAGRIVARVKPNIVLTDEVAGNPTAVVELRCAPDGSIIGRKLVKSSGNQGWDDAVLRAIDKTGVLPRDVDGRVPSSIEISFRPQE